MTTNESACGQGAARIVLTNSTQVTRLEEIRSETLDSLNALSGADRDDEAGYTAAEAFARSILQTAVEGGINHWAHVTHYRWDCPPEQVSVQGHDDEDDSELFVVDLAKIQATLDTLADHPNELPIATLNDRYSVEIPALLRTIRQQLAAGTPWLETDDADFDAGDADVIFQLTVHGAVIYG